jgi:hypothetical protein
MADVIRERVGADARSRERQAERGQEIRNS